MSVHLACIFCHHIEPSSFKLDGIQTLLKCESLENCVLSDYTEEFHEDFAPHRSVDQRCIEFSQLSIEIGAYCVYLCIRSNWIAVDSMETSWRRLEMCKNFAKLFKCVDSLLVFPDSMLGYDYAQTLAAVADFVEVTAWFQAKHGKPRLGMDGILKWNGNMVISSGYLLIPVGVDHPGN